MLNIQIKKINDTEVEIVGEVPFAELEKYRPKIINYFNQTLKIDGFRPGHIPEKIIVDKVGEEKILIEAAEEVLQDLYPKIIQENKIDAIGQPAVTITKLAKDNPFGFTFKTAIIPEIKLPDYKKIATDTINKADKTPEVEEKELEEVINEIRKQRAIQPEEDKELELPELNDEFVKSLGKFESVDDFKQKIKENLQAEKEQRHREKIRLQIMENIGEKVEVKLPNLLIESELDKMVNELKRSVSQMNLKFEDYLNHLKKTELELRTSWQQDAEKRVKLGLIINSIIDKEKLQIKPEELTKELDHLLSHYPEKPSDKEINQLKSYIENSLLHDKVFRLLEEQK